MKKNFWRTALILMLCLCLTGCASGTPPTTELTATPSPTADPTATPTAAPTAEPTPEPSPTPDAQSELSGGGEEGMYTEFGVMEPLFTAHILAQLNGMTFDMNSPEYFWQTVIFAIDGCGMDFYSAETFGSALVLSRGVIEEIASGLFEGGGTHLLEIPQSLSGEIVYDKDADAFSHPLSDGGFSASLTSVKSDTANGEAVWKITGEFFSDAMPNSAITAFSAELVRNTREGNSLFEFSVRELKIG